ncbi:hypothetical protein CA267_010400 [Alteromonas pelagimontana]|uniref:Uncharacterized protein n=1 Tax=Alteromonas pelagimontana TaxID=1858656 RepID=A0A6M4MEU8_9ALTE|nr:hypothetical protein [Alteromonas pelagimontana]QJR81160.1 hypothetical protein CA267_010400 [Alteromonas pelagimontana]
MTRWTTTRIDNHSLARFIGPHPYVVLSCHAAIPAPHLFLFLRLMRELNTLGADDCEFHVFYIDVDERTGIPTPQVEIIGDAERSFETVADRYERLYQLTIKQKPSLKLGF